MTHVKPTEQPEAAAPTEETDAERAHVPEATDPATGQPASAESTATAGEPEAAGHDPTARVAELEAELAETKERLLRALAETENLRRRNARELEDARKYAISGFARELLEVADNLSRALESIPPRAREEILFVKNLADGVALTEKALGACFERHQIAKVAPRVGDRFDHNRHQAMLEIEAEEVPPGTIAQVLQPGYVIADRLLRPALVGIAKAPAEAPGEGQPSEPETSAGDAAPAGETRRDGRIDRRA